MKLVDLNLLLYAYNSTAREHKDAAVWLSDLFAGRETIGLAWVTLIGFLRIATSPKSL